MKRNQKTRIENIISITTSVYKLSLCGHLNNNNNTNNNNNNNNNNNKVYLIKCPY